MLDTGREKSARRMIIVLVLLSQAGLAGATVGLNKSNVILLLAGIVEVAVCLIGIFLILYLKNRSLSSKSRRTASEVESASRRQADPIQYDPNAVYLTLLIGVVGEIFPYLIGIPFTWILPLAYVTTMITLYRYKIDSFGSNQFLASFFYFTSLFGVLFSSFAVHSPKLLASTGLMDIYASANTSLLFFMYAQVSLVYSSMLLLAYAHRGRLHRKWKLENPGYLDFQKKVMIKLSELPRFEELKLALFDTSTVGQLFLNGNYTASSALAWSVIDRSLEVLSGTRDDIKGAKKIGFYDAEFAKCYAIRNKMIHDGYVPKSRDTIDFERQIMSLYTFLDSKPLSDLQDKSYG